MPEQFNIADIRKNYSRQELTEDKIQNNPFAQFNTWLQEAINAQLPEPTAMVLSTVNAAGFPSARVVLLKGLEDGQFVFYTNYNSRKGQELLAQPQASLTFFWAELERQVRIEGLVQQVDPALSDAYYNIRPRGSQVGAWVSPQSQEIPSREALEKATADYEQKFGPDNPIPRPAHWGGYGLVPTYLEFWQGRPNRLHDRLVFSRENPTATDWRLYRIAP